MKCFWRCFSVVLLVWFVWEVLLMMMMLLVFVSVRVLVIVFFVVCSLKIFVMLLMLLVRFFWILFRFMKMMGMLGKSLVCCGKSWLKMGLLVRIKMFGCCLLYLCVRELVKLLKCLRFGYCLVLRCLKCILILGVLVKLERSFWCNFCV